jgi:myo-inositol 2-dehydrogenase / D-chiro-inositol 1-dehydrogenase
MDQSSLSRRSFLTRAAVGASAFTIIKPQLVRGAGSERLKAGLIGCGARGTQAVENILTGCPNVELVAVADIFEDRLEGSITKSLALAPELAGRVKVDAEHRFVGFDGYKKVLASDIDIAMLATPPAYRPIHFEAAVDAKKHIFCEKPFGTDAVNVRRFMAAAKKSEELKLTVKSGAQRRSQAWYLDQYKRLRDGEFGDVVGLYAHWVGGPVLQFNGNTFPPNHKRDPRWSDMEFQNRGWYSFVWVCGDQVVEQHLHNIDVCNWFMGTHPVEVIASGGAAWRPREEEYGNIYDHLTADFTYANGVRMSSHCRQFPGKEVAQDVSERIACTKGAIDSAALRGAKLAVNPYVQEHIDMVDSILGKSPYVNEAMAVAESTMTCIMAREAAYSGMKITWDMMMGSQKDLLPKSFEYKQSLVTPPLPVPGEYKFV